MPELAIRAPVDSLPATIGVSADAIRPFQVSFPETDLADLRRRINATNWPERETVSDETQGVPLALIQELAGYWGSEYDWRKCEARLNELPHFITEIDRLDVHFIHVRSRHEDALPLIITHGWPGSIIHLLKIIEPLTNPTAHGASASDAFHLVIPSLPGYGFSGKPASVGWNPERIARAWVELMKRLGYQKFVAQGGDWGALVVDLMGKQAAPELLGIHTNLPAAVPAEIMRAIHTHGPLRSDLSSEERVQAEKISALFTTGLGYAIEMGTRPQTLYGLVDSPIGLAAWLIDLGDGDAKPAAAVTAALRTTGESKDELTRDDVLDNITLFWLTKTGLSASRLYWENKLPFFEPSGVSIPVAVSAFPGEFYQPPRSWVERAYPKLIHYSQPEKGSHFPAWEQPQVFSAELRAGFRSLRTVSPARKSAQAAH
jgi:pimeloyl-ACP methyl ester carboxylesterase